MNKLLSVKAASELLQVHPGTIYRWVYARKIKCHRYGRMIRFKGSDLEQFFCEMPDDGWSKN